MKKLLFILSSVILINCHGQNDRKVVELGLKKDAINSEFFKEIIAQDSIKIIEFKKFTHDDTFKAERIVYIDFKFNNSDRKKVLTDKIENHKAEFMNDSKESSKGYVSQFKDINGTYVPVRKYKGDYCLYYFEIAFSKTITDTAFVSLEMDGYSSIAIKNVQRNNQNTICELVDNGAQIKSIEIKTIDPKLNIQIWRTQMDVEGPQFSYEMMIPTKNISKIPILYTLTSDMIDQNSENLDEIDLEKLFK